MAAPLDSLIGEGLAPSPYAQTRGAYDDLLQICIRYMWVSCTLIALHGHTPDTRTVSADAVRRADTRRMPA